MNRLQQLPPSTFLSLPNSKLPIQRLLIVQQVFKQYRLALYQQLAEQLAAAGIELTLCFSLPQGAEIAKADNIITPPGPFAQLVPLRKFGPLVWQTLPDTADFDLVIVEQANRHLVNYVLLLQRMFRAKPKVVFWGHGFNHQADAGFWSSAKELYKKWLLKRADGFFAYTEPVARYVAQQGVAAARITVLNNSIETTIFAAKVQSMRRQQAAALAANQVAELAAGSEATSKPGLTLLYCGALYPDKKIPLLLQTARFLADRQALKRLIVLGDGPDRHLLLAEQAAQHAQQQQNSAEGVWLDYRGACFDDDKAAAYAEADLVLHPGLLGLAVLDAFAAGLPVLTTQFKGHSPEAAYLQHGFNGLLVTETALPQVALELTQCPAELKVLALGAADSAGRYSLEAMVHAFVGGVRKMMPVTS